MKAPSQVTRELLALAVAQSQDGITIVDAQASGLPLIYVNEGFEKLTGYAAAELLGHSYRVLQGQDTEQAEIATLATAVSQAQACTVVLRNYRKDGSMFWNELSISPVVNPEGTLTHYIGIQKDVTARVLLEQHLHQSNLDLRSINQQLNTLVNTDPVLGLSTRQHFEERLAELRSTALRTRSALSILFIDPDQFSEFNQHYGRAAGDECLHMLGLCIAKSFARTSDCVARYSGEKFAITSLSANIDDLRIHLNKLCDSVRALNIPHSSTAHGIVTVSIGGIHRQPDRETSSEVLLQRAEAALQTAKHSGRNCVQIIN